MTEIRYDYLKKLQKWGMNLTPVQSNKKPELKNGKWFHAWTLRELAKKERIGVWHKSGFYDIDFDDEKFNCHKFMSLFPETLTTGKLINGKPVATHLIYNSGTETPSYESYPSSVKKGGKKIELLTNKQTWILGDDRVVIRDVPPSQYPSSLVSQYVKMTYAFAELFEHWPESGIKMRDEAHMKLAGALARDTKIITNIKEEFVKKLCELTFDTEINNRVRKVKYQEKQLIKNPEKVWGIGGLSTHLGVNLPAFDVLKNNVEKEEIKKSYPLIDGNTLTDTDYPKPKYIMKPLIRERTCSQIFGGYGSGKTHFCFSLGMYLASGLDFLDYKTNRAVPVLYVEGELPSADLRDRRDSIMADMIEKKKDFKFENHYILGQDDLEMAGFKHGFEPIGVSRSNSDEDKGRRGRELIENTCLEIKKKHGVMPYLFLDNITALTDIDENRAQDWQPIMWWLIHLKNKGIANAFVHHSNKSTGTSSGSNAKERLIDLSIRIEKLDSKHRFQMGGTKNVQCSLSFDKARNFGGSSFDTEFILTCDDYGKWTKYPMLDQNDFTIIEGHKKGLSPKDMKEEFEDLKIAEKTIYKRLKRLKDIGVIKDENNRQTTN